MGSKKSKKKKIKCKKKLKCSKLKNVIKDKGMYPYSTDGYDSDEISNENKSIRNRLLEESSRSNTDGKGISNLKNFAQIRERYFSYLKTVVLENCAFCQSQPRPSVAVLESLSLELEQEALLASLQKEIYIRSISEIINDIKNCTKKKLIHKEVKKILPLEQNNSVTSANEETYLKIPTISHSRTDNYQEPMDNEYINFDETAQCYSYHNLLSSAQTTNNTALWNDGACPVNEDFVEKYCCNSKDENILDNSNILPDTDNNIVNSENRNSVSIEPSQTHEIIVPKCESVKVEVLKLNPLQLSLNQLQKSVEKTLDSSEKILKQKAEEKDRAYIAQILEGEDSFDDSLSENEGTDENFQSRLEKMREIFGVEDNHKRVSQVKSKPLQRVKMNQHSNKSKRPNVWKNEKVIQQYKFALLSSEMSLTRQAINKRLFLELFGDDSDEENEALYRSEEKYRLSCTERISPWVVKHLMPYYYERRIVGRKIFKSLGHHISDVIVDEIQYPDEWTVKYFVSKFFQMKKKYVTDADIQEFEL